MVKPLPGSVLLVTAGLALPAPRADAGEIVRVPPEFREEESFHRIAEYFTGREYTGRRTIIRSDADTREGFYLTVRLRKVDRETFPSGTARLEVAMPGENLPRTYDYSLETVERRRPLILLGITGDDWPEDLERPLAWKLTFLDANGEPIDSEQSFLWSLDEKP